MGGGRGGWGDGKGIFPFKSILHLRSSSSYPTQNVFNKKLRFLAMPGQTFTYTERGMELTQLVKGLSGCAALLEAAQAQQMLSLQ